MNSKLTVEERNSRAKALEGSLTAESAVEETKSEEILETETENQVKKIPELELGPETLEVLEPAVEVDKKDGTRIS